MLINKRILYLLCSITFLAVCITVVLEYRSGYYNNYLIFTKPIIHFLQEKSVYGFNEQYYLDTFKYSPLFALVIGVLQWLPDIVGLFIWNLLNVFVLLRGIHLFFETDKDKLISVLLLFPTIILTTHNHQSNGIIAGCLLLALYYLRQNKSLPAALCTALCLFIKFYGVAAVVLCILYKCRVKFLVQLTTCILILAVVPLLFVSPSYLVQAYQEWWHTLNTVYLSIQCSVMGILQTWFHLSISLGIVGMSGLLLFLLPWLSFSLYENKVFRNLLAASLLITIIIFNKMAEIPTYIVALTGLCIWWANTKQKDMLDWLIISLIMITQILSLHYWPRSLMDNWLLPYSFTAAPYFLLWIKLQIRLWKMEAPQKVFSHSLIIK